MPSVSPKQQRFMRAELGRKKRGRPTKTGMSLPKLEDFAMKVKKPSATGTYKPPKFGA